MEGPSDCKEKNKEINTEVAEWEEWAEVDPDFTLQHSSRCYIYKIPRELLVDNEEKYEPHTVSIGPYHHGKSMEITEDHKKVYLRSFMERSYAPETMWRDLINKIHGLQDAARRCYSESIDLNDKEFARMLILDGCFVLELLYKHHEHKHDLEDIIYSKPSNLIDSIRRDFVLLENQIPFSVLECLFHLVQFPYSLNELIIPFFVPILPPMSVNQTDSTTRGMHLLDLLRKLLIPSWPAGYRYLGKNACWQYTTSATDLQEAGVTFESNFLCNFLDIKFSDGKFEIPLLSFYGESWTVLFPNIIALEQCCHFYEDEITSYAIVISRLINSPSDVNMLRRKGIIFGSSKEDEKIAQTVKTLCKNVAVENFLYKELCWKVSEYRWSTYRKLRAAFMRHIVHTLWGGFFVAAAIILLVLAIMQIVSSVLP